MNLQQINLESLNKRFFQNSRITRIAKFIERFPQNESAPDLEDLLRNHAEEPIEDEGEIDSRDALDSLLAYYSLLEIASLIGYIPTFLPEAISVPALRILSQPDVKRYYQRHYRWVLPEMFLYRLEKRGNVFDAKQQEEAATLFAQFLIQVGWLERDKSISMFRWLLDDGIHNGCDWTKLVAPLKKPRLFFKLILNPKRSEETISLGLKGLVTFVQTCRDLDALLLQAEQCPLLQSAMWHYHSYWFTHLKQKIGHELEEVLRLFQKWEGFSDNKELYRKEIQNSLNEVDGALKSLLDGHYGKPLNEVARTLRLEKPSLLPARFMTKPNRNL